MNSKLNEGIRSGLHNVGVFLMWWFIIMCVIGGTMRCYLCFDTLLSGNFTIRSLYHSFADREPDTASDDEDEGIALDTIRRRQESGYN